MEFFSALRIIIGVLHHVCSHAHWGKYSVVATTTHPAGDLQNIPFQVRNLWSHSIYLLQIKYEFITKSL